MNPLQAQQQPLAFAQVREDPLQDASLLQSIKGPIKMAMIASGGCTAAYLCQNPQLKQLILVDANPAQLGLTKIKLHLLQHHATPERCAFLGHHTMQATERFNLLQTLCADLALPTSLFGDASVISHQGLDYAGRYEWLFQQLAHALKQNATLHEQMQTLLNLNTATAQTQFVAQHPTLMPELAELFTQQLDLNILIALFGAEATQNPVQSFAMHFLTRVQWAIKTLPAYNNPYLWQMLYACNPPKALTPWLSLPQQPIHTQISYQQAEMGQALTQQHDLNCIHLSNILDWLSVPHAQATLQAAFQALAPQGFVIIRQLNSDVDIRQIGHKQGFIWRDDLAKPLMQTDRSFFYRQLYIGQKPCA